MENMEETAVSQSLLDSVTMLQGWLCPTKFKLRLGNEWEGPLAQSYEFTVEEDEFIIREILLFQISFIPLYLPMILKRWERRVYGSTNCLGDKRP